MIVGQFETQNNKIVASKYLPAIFVTTASQILCKNEKHKSKYMPTKYFPTV